MGWRRKVRKALLRLYLHSPLLPFVSFLVILLIVFCFFSLRLFGDGVVKSIREYVLENYFGEAPPFSSFIIPTGHNKARYLVYVSLPSDQRSYTYLVAWSAFSAVMRHNRGILLTHTSGVLSLSPSLSLSHLASFFQICSLCFSRSTS